MLKHSEGFAKIFVHCLFFLYGTSKTFFEQVAAYGNLLVPVQVSTFAISTPLHIDSITCMYSPKFYTCQRNVK